MYLQESISFLAIVLAFLLVSLAFQRRIFNIIEDKRQKWFAGLFVLISKIADEGVSSSKFETFKVLHEMAAASEAQSRSLRIVEIGAGPGANFRYMPDNCELTCVDPNRHFEKILFESANKNPGMKQVKFQLGRAEDMSFIDTGSIDACVCTYVFCSVDDIRRSLKEVKRILKKGGRLIFMEHVLYDSHPWLRMVQCIVRLPWFYLFGCRLSDQFIDCVHQAGFTEVSAERFEPEHFGDNTHLVKRFMFRMAKPHLAGFAVK